MQNKIVATRRFQFCAGHRVHLHESKCNNMHGHNYVLYVHAESDELDELGRVIDFGVLKEKILPWIDQNWDHAFIRYIEDTEILEAITKVEGQRYYNLETNPTAENMALHLIQTVLPHLLLGTGIHIGKVVLWETENCQVIVTRDNPNLKYSSRSVPC